MEVEERIIQLETCVQLMLKDEKKLKDQIKYLRRVHQDAINSLESIKNNLKATS